MIIVYTGNGKGKTTAALGLALRAIGWGKKVLIVQFLKKHETGETKLIKKLGMKNWELVQYGTKEFVDPKNPKSIDYQEAKKGHDYSLLMIHNLLFDMVILDEINVVIKFSLLKKEEILKTIKEAQEKNIDLVLTGRGACPEIIKKADLVTEFTEINHPFNKGQKARKGIDY